MVRTRAQKKAVDKGKRPMEESENEVHEAATRPRTTGIFITESQVNRPVPEVVRPQRVPEQAMARDEGVKATDLSPPTRHVETGGSSGVAQPVIQMDPRMDTVIELLTQLVQAQAQAQARTSAGPSPSITAQPQVRESEQAIVRPLEQELVVRQIDDKADMRVFQDLRPPTFKGETDFQVVEDWIDDMENIFSYLQCTEEQKVRYATFMLKGDAYRWWRLERQLLPNEGRGLDWAGFLDRFLTHFIPESERDRRAAEFATLTQGKMTVAEYDAKFRSLSRFVSWSRTDQRELARKFKSGLKPSLRGKLSVLRLTDYTDILERARGGEEEEEIWAKSQEHKRGLEQKKNGGRGRGKGQRQRGVRGHYLERQSCPTCGKMHAGQCRLKTGACFQCGQMGHRKSECPTLQMSIVPQPQRIQHQQSQAIKAPSQAGAQRGRGRPPQFQPLRRQTDQLPQLPIGVNAVTAREAQASEGVITGSLVVSNSMALVLFDPGATHSFIATHFVERVHVPTSESREVFNVSSPVKMLCNTTKICKGVAVMIDYRLFYADLIVIDMKDFDVILGMDWLSKWNATLDCRSKKVVLRPFDAIEVVFSGTPMGSVPKLVSALKAMSLYRQGCPAYLASVVDVEPHISKVEDIPVVRDFSDLFPDELPGLPPERDVVFGVELQPGTVPISKAPYRMAPTEMAELKK